MKKRYWKEIESRANSILDRFLKELQELRIDLPAIPPVPISDICALRGLCVNAVSNLRYENKKLAGMLDARARAISIEATDILGRQHFSIAHELGHYELHWLPQQYSQTTLTLFPIDKFVDETIDFHFRCTPEDMKLQAHLEMESTDLESVFAQDRRKALEVEANQFAALLLMPEQMVRDWARRLQGDVVRLAYQFEVSPAAMHWRLIKLKMRMGKEEVQIQRQFFLHLSESPIESASLECVEKHAGSLMQVEQASIQVTPETKLRTLISEVDVLERTSDEIVLDLTPFETGELGSIGPTQALDLALLNDYIHDHIIPMRTIATESFDLTVRPPTATSYVTRHLSRLGVFDYLPLTNEREAASGLPREPFAASGTSVLLRLTKIDSALDLGSIACSLSTSFLNWTGSPTNLQVCADYLEWTLLSLTQNIIDHSGTRPGLGTGYVVAQLEPVVYDNHRTGYRIVIAAGDIGIGVRSSLNRGADVHFDADFEALKGYLEGSTISQLRAAMMRDWSGHLQLNSGDTMLSVGSRGTTHLTGLYCLPGLQVTMLVNCSL